MIDLSVSGGFTAPQRQVLREYLVKEWKTMSADNRKELLTDLERWSEAAGQGSASGEADNCIGALRPKVMAQLGTTQDRQLSRWLLEVVNKDREQHARNLALEKLRHQGVVQALDAMPTSISAYWKYNPKSGKYDIWVPRR
jgi:hypothetical protein